ncbi:uncharacterized protein [Mytilus edulis]|uniref:uncharacterized protein n=1 Tax=Mytilus edulis TaxID=6550 RepID=UPI0039F0434C
MPSKKSDKSPFCHRCEDAKVVHNARYKCLQCKEKLCSGCAQNHMILRLCTDFRIVDMRNGLTVDSVFSIEPDNDHTTEMERSKDVHKQKTTESPHRVVRTFGKPILQLTMRKSNKIEIPITQESRCSSKYSFPALKEDNNHTWRKAEILANIESSAKGDFNENGDFFPASSHDERKDRNSILKRSSSFKSDTPNSLWYIETQRSYSSAPQKKEVRFNTSKNTMNTISEEPKGILREYSNNFYLAMGKQKSKKISEPSKSSYLPVKKLKKNTSTGLSMVSQSSIVIEQQEIAGKISGVLFLNENYLVVIDRLNHKMKVFNARDRYRMVVDKKIPKGSWGVASPEDNIIAMTCRCKIIFYGLFETQTPRYEKPQDPYVQALEVEYRLRATCYGISFCESRDLFFVACNVFFSDPCIFIVDTKGYTQQIIRTIDDGISPSIPFTETLAVDSERGVMYIGDRMGKRLVCATYEGHHVWNVQLAGKPVSIACENENIHVCVDGRVISTIHKDGRLLKNSILLDLDGRRICYHEQSNQLVVLTKAFWGVSHFIQVYQL